MEWDPKSRGIKVIVLPFITFTCALFSYFHKLTFSDGGINDQDRSLLSSRRSSRSRYRGSDGSLARKYPAEWYKTVIMFIYALGCIATMSVVEAIVHDKVPRK